MMKILLVGLNSKFVHTNLAIRNIAAFCENTDIALYEATINDSLDDVLEDIVFYNADIIGFSCYIWNIQQVLYLAENIKKVSPKTLIICGGPEVSYDVKYFLNKSKNIDIIIIGEGEYRFKNLVLALKNGRKLENLDGIAYRKGKDIVVNMPVGYVDLDEVPLSYRFNENLENKLVYYEASRGCPFGCAFCLSSLDRKVRFSNLQKVKEDFTFFAKKGVKVVKMVDRSFNCNKNRAIQILDIIRKLPRDTVFHWEVNPELVDDDFIKNLKGLEEKVQFEVGLQSTYEKSLEAISRPTRVKDAIKGIKKLKEAKIPLHADLIAGLPHENFERFSRSFDDLYSLHPDEIQLGFLKLLRGTSLTKKASKYGIVYESRPPYEVLYTKDISYKELRILKGIAHLVDKFYNDGRFKHSLLFLEKYFNRPFDMYYCFYKYCFEKDLFKCRHSLKARYDILFNFVKTLNLDHEVFRDLLSFDFLFYNGKQAPPKCLRRSKEKKFRDEAKRYLYDEDWVKENLPLAMDFSGSEISRYTCFGYFKHDVPDNTINRNIGIIFLNKNGKRSFAKFDLDRKKFM